MKYYKWLLGTMCIFALIYSIYIFYPKNIQANNPDDVSPNQAANDYRDNLVKELLKADNRPQNRKDIVKIYCDTILSGDFVKGFQREFLDYKPKESFFIYQLCNGLSDAKDLTSYKSKWNNNIDTDIKNLSLTKYSFKNFDANCDPNTSMNDCSIGMLSNDIYKSLMSDMTNAKVAGIMVFNSANAEDAIKKFSNDNFGIDTANGDDGNNYYLYKSQIEGTFDYTSHPKTYKYLSDTLTALKKLNGNYINTRKIQLMSPNNDIEKFLYQALTDISYTRFEQFLQREFFRYDMLIGYYTTLLPGDARFVPTRFGDNFLQAYDEVNREIAKSTDQIAIMQDTIQITQQMIKNIQVTFPIHIGLLALKEDLELLRLRLAQLYTPLHQLHYKLMNVQDTKRK